MRIFIIFLCIFLNSGNFYCQLIRPNFIYENVIKEVYDHYNNTCIIMLHATENPIEGQGLRESENLLNFQLFFSRAYIPTKITSIYTFGEQIGDSYFHMIRPLFVLLNDDDDVRQYAIKLASVILNYHTWLIFLREETPIMSFFEDIYVKFDSTMMASQPDGNLSSPGEIITEVYQIHEGDKLRSSLLGTWNQEMGLKLSQLSLYQRRNNLQGHTLRVTSLEDPPLSTIIHDHNGAVTGLGGFFGGLMDLLQESMNFTILWQETNKCLDRDENGSYTGAIGQLIGNTTDIVAAEVLMSTPRLNAISFTTPVYSTKFRIYIKEPTTSAFNWGAYFVPLEPKVWIAIFVTIAITTITMFLVSSAISLFASHWKDNEDIPTSVLDIFFAVFGVFCGQGMVASTLDPIRITHFVIHLTGVTILTAYSADMISALTVKIPVMPFTTLEGLLQDGTYRFGVVVDSPGYSPFKNGQNETYRAIFNEFLIKEKNLPNNDLEGLRLVCSVDKYAFLTRDVTVSQLQSQIGCTLVPLDTIVQRPIALGLRLRSPYQGLINSHLSKLRESGVIHRLLHPNSTMTGDNVDKGLESVEIKAVLPLLLLLFAGVFMGLMILGIEKFLKRNEEIIKKEKKIVKQFLKNIKLPSTQENHLQLRLGSEA